VRVPQEPALKYVNVCGEGYDSHVSYSLNKPFHCMCLSQSQFHGRIVRKLSKKLKVGGRKLVTPPSDFVPVRSSSPVLFSVNTPPITLHSLVEEEEEVEGGGRGIVHNGTDSVGEVW